MKLVESILTKNPCYTAGRKITVKGLMLHSVGCSQPKASVFINSWNKATYSRACVHGFIDGNDGTVYQTLPWNHRGWHAGSSMNGSANNTHIGVEMCEPSTIKYTSNFGFKVLDEADAKAVAKRTYDAAVELFAMLCKTYGLDPLGDGVIISHSEGNKRGIASNHGDPEHLWKGLGLGYTMDGFRQAVKEAMGTEETKTTVKTMGTMTEKELWDFFKSKGMNDYGIAGLMGNLYAESGLKANNLQNAYEKKLGMTDAEYTAAVDDGTYTNFVKDSAGYGLAQWTYWSRKQYLLQKCNELGTSIGDAKMQCEYLMWELEGSYPSVLRTLKNAESVREASDAVLTKYEAPADQGEAMQKKRAAFGQIYFDKYAASIETSIASNLPECPFLVQVIIADLNVRADASTDAKVNGQTGKGVFTIVEVKDGWGRLKSGAGWVWLGNSNYCTVLNTVKEEKTVDEIANEVIQGKWGNGTDRKKRLTEAGYDYKKIQSRVNELCK